MGSFMICAPQMKEDESGQACGTCVGMHTRFRWRNLKEKAKLEDIEADWRIILESALNK